MSPLGWMFLGYSLLWGAIVLYVANLGRRQAALQREIRQLHAAVDASAEGDAPEAVGASLPGALPVQSDR